MYNLVVGSEICVGRYKSAYIKTGGMEINTQSYSGFRFRLFEWMQTERKKSLRVASEKWPDDEEFIGEISAWFDRVGDLCGDTPPKKDVRYLIVTEDILGDVKEIAYEYYCDDDEETDEIEFRLTCEGVDEEEVSTLQESAISHLLDIREEMSGAGPGS